MLVRVTLPPDESGMIETAMFDAYAVSSKGNGSVEYGQGGGKQLPRGSTIRVMVNGQWAILKGGK